MNIAKSNPGLFNSTPANWLYIGLIPSVAVASGLAVYQKPDLFMLVLTLDLWLLGYHHVISTYTRIGFDKASAKQHWGFLLPLPLALVGVVGVGYHLVGGVLIASVYLYWQWYHYTRQSEGIAKAYGLKHSDRKVVPHPINRAMFYGIATISFIWMITRQDAEFLGMSFWSFSLPEPLRQVLLILLLISTGCWLTYLTRLLLKKVISPYYFCYMLSHAVIYITAYVVIEPINYGWLTINIWHNAQYIFFVWLYNNKRYSAGIEPQHRLVSYLSQNGRIVIYLLFCLLISTAVYQGLEAITTSAQVQMGLPAILLLYATVNFHHYIIDSRIWKLRKPQMQSHLELNSA